MKPKDREVRLGASSSSRCPADQAEAMDTHEQESTTDQVTTEQAEQSED